MNFEEKGTTPVVVQEEHEDMICYMEIIAEMSHASGESIGKRKTD